MCWVDQVAVMPLSRCVFVGVMQLPPRVGICYSASQAKSLVTVLGVVCSPCVSSILIARTTVDRLTEGNAMMKPAVISSCLHVSCCWLLQDFE